LRKRVAAILLGLVGLLVLTLFVDAAALRGGFAYAMDNPLGLLAAFLAYTGAFALRALAWAPLAGGQVSLIRLFSLILAALFLNHAAPAKAGDLARIYGLAQRGVRAGRAAASVILARLADLVGLLVILVASWAYAGGGDWALVAAPGGVVAATAFAIWAFAHLRIPTPTRPQRLAGAVAKLQDALREASPRVLGTALIWATPAWALEAGILYFAARGVGIELSFSEAVVASCFAVLVTSVPLTPGGLGTYEAGAVFVLVAFGSPPELAFAAAVLSHAMKFLYALAAAPFAFTEGLAVVQARQKSEKRKVEPDETSVEV
jgi:uncharacterized membrane protein YbhN (UPF0104 family)